MVIRSAPHRRLTNTYVSQFFQRENFLTLNNIRRGLGEALEDVGGRRRKELGGEEKAAAVETALAGAGEELGIRAKRAIKEEADFR